MLAFEDTVPKADEWHIAFKMVTFVPLTCQVWHGCPSLHMIQMVCKEMSLERVELAPLEACRSLSSLEIVLAPSLTMMESTHGSQ